MANEVSASASLTYSDASGVVQQIAVLLFQSSPGTLKVSRTKQTINTTETAIKLGDTTAPGWVAIVNFDTANYVDVKVAASGAIFARLEPSPLAGLPGGFCVLKLGSGAQAPVAVANTAACLVDVMAASS